MIFLVLMFSNILIIDKNLQTSNNYGCSEKKDCEIFKITNTFGISG